MRKSSDLQENTLIAGAKLKGLKKLHRTKCAVERLAINLKAELLSKVRKDDASM